MKPDYFQDTVAAISTPVGKGAIAIIRLSGDNAIDIASRIFYNPKIDLHNSPSHVLHYGKLKDINSNAVIDEVLLTVMHPESSFTRENLIEINCHGGDIIPYTILKLLLSLGARLADPGEFTRRAFLNGKIDLTQAEAIHDIIAAKSKLSSKLAVSNLEKRFSKVIKRFKEDIIKTTAHLELNIDYPEEDLEEIDYEFIKSTANQTIVEIDKILKDSKNGKILKQGVKVAIVGKTNVGKSSLFNYLVREDKAIVSHIHGTTRDFLETHVSISDIPIHLVDTAGFRKTDNEIEKIGKDRSKKMMSEADFVLWILDNSIDWAEDDDKILSYIDQAKVIFIINKIDLPQNLDINDISQKIPGKDIFYVSLLEKSGLDKLEQGLKTIFLGEDCTFNEQSIICNLRQETLLVKTRTALEKALLALEDGLSYEFIALDLREALDFLGEIVGEVTTDDILNEIFDNFCIGK